MARMCRCSTTIAAALLACIVAGAAERATESKSYRDARQGAYGDRPSLEEPTTRRASPRTSANTPRLPLKESSRSDSRVKAASATEPVAETVDDLPRTRPFAGRPPALLPPRPVKTSDAAQESSATIPGLGSVFVALAAVLGLLFAITWLLKRAMPQGSALLPTEVVQVLGRAPLAARQTVQLVRCGQKLILLSVTPTGAEALTEITEPAEVARLTALCQRTTTPVRGRGLPDLLPAKDNRTAETTGSKNAYDLDQGVKFAGLPGRPAGREANRG